MMKILEINGAGKTYQTEHRTIEAVKATELALEEGDFCCILGKSGSGKSTLLNLCVGILLPTAGSIAFAGKELSQMDDAELSFLRNDKIGYIMQGYALLSNLTVRSNIQLPHFMYRRERDIDELTNELLETVGLADKADCFPSELSGGEIRRVEIARALINNPMLIVADEPTGDLDKINAQAIMELFQKINQKGTTILMVTHDLDATTCANRLYTMEDGVLFSGDRISIHTGRLAEE